MIRVLNRFIATDNHENLEYIELTCLSTDTKPTSGIITGSKATEVDTGDVYRYDEIGETWYKQ